MTKKIDNFIEEGMKRYKEASYMLVRFGKEVEKRLKKILEKREDWGQFSPKVGASAKSTSYWSEYPLLNAKIDGVLRGKEITIMIAVNWWEADSEYPFYSVCIEPQGGFPELPENFENTSGIEHEGDSLRFYPNPDDFNIERDFNLLLDEFVRFLKVGD